MIKIELPDGSIKEVEAGISGFELANLISPNLAKAALAIETNGTLTDTTTPITCDAKVKIITAKDKSGLDILRHSCSHIMSEALLLKTDFTMTLPEKNHSPQTILLK